jgi:hypothetical protein
MQPALNVDLKTIGGKARRQLRTAVQKHADCPLLVFEGNDLRELATYLRLFLVMDNQLTLYTYWTG